MLWTGGVLLFSVSKHILQLGEEAFAFLIILVIRVVVQLGQNLLLTFVQIFGHLHCHLNILVAPHPGVVEILYPFPLQPEHVPGLGALMDVVADPAVQSGHLHIRAQGRLGISHQTSLPLR